MTTRGWMVAVALGTLVPGAAAAQGIDDAVAGMDEGVVRVAYATRPGVEVCDQGIRMGDHQMYWRSRGWDERPSNCVEGSVEVEIEVRDGRVRDVDVVRGRDNRTPDARVLDEVSPQEAVDYFLEIASSGPRNVADDAVLPAYLADVEDVWLDLLEVAKDRTANQGARKTALFWVGQEAADAATDGLADFARDEDEEQEVRNAAIFALSQRPDDEGVPILMEVAQTADNAESRRQAMFWLAQSDDARVVDFFENVLLGRGGG